MEPMRKTRSERFWGYVDRSAGEAACWPWQAFITTTGYGRFRLPRRHVRAHRFAWEEVNGPVPDGLFVCHTCDNRPCCNPAHLWLGTAKDNAQDMVRKGRASRISCPPERRRRGADAKWAKLSEAAVLDIRTRAAVGELQSVLAAEYGVSRPSIRKVLFRKSWTHVAGPTYTPRGRGKKMTAEQAAAVPARIAAGEPRAKIAADLGVTSGAIGHIVQGRTWR